VTAPSPPRVPVLEPAGTAIVAPSRPSLPARVARRLVGVATYAFALAVAAFWLLPTFGLFVESLRDPKDIAASGWWTAFVRPGQLTLVNYQHLLANSDVLGSLWNTLLITVPATILMVAFGALAGYALAWLDFRGRQLLFLVVVALIVVPVQIAIIPDAKIFRALHIYGTTTAVVAFHVAFGLPFAVFLLRNYFLGIPTDLVEAARVDGGAELAIFVRVVLPMSRPAIAALAVYQFVWVWNDLLVALVFARPDSAPITYQLQAQMRTFSTNIDVIGPAAFLSMVVPLVVFFVLQRHFVKGALADSMRAG